MLQNRQIKEYKKRKIKENQHTNLQIRGKIILLENVLEYRIIVTLELYSSLIKPSHHNHK